MRQTDQRRACGTPPCDVEYSQAAHLLIPEGVKGFAPPQESQVPRLTGFSAPQEHRQVATGAFRFTGAGLGAAGAIALGLDAPQRLQSLK